MGEKKARRCHEGSGAVNLILRKDKMGILLGKEG